MYYNDSRINKSDGVAIYISENIIEITEIIQINNLKIVNSTITLTNNKEIILSEIYRSHDTHETEFLLNINNLIIGDFNCDILNQDVVDQEYLQVFLENGYYPLSKIKYKTFTLSVPSNNYYPIMISLKGIKNNSSHEEHKKINYNKLREAAERVNWSDILLMSDPNLALNDLVLKIETCTKKAEYKVRKNNHNKLKLRKDWITKAITISCNKKEELYKISKSDPSNLTKKEAYNNYVKILNRIIYKEKEEFDKKQIEINMFNQRNL
ncbi:hypothetical protein TSAR_004815 [Trichomalopsis sarcophagae]|uniref:Endonuclease/exonuclease/phosphatase domain-containing protein n=1 Tax=Trichomalopsis sarcophagae TaxID=543379 RepID=A0A232EEG2_9HYME|nr:hypothetical protein TSAR_004815 [Trichomalopsis sarcophagae]